MKTSLLWFLLLTLTIGNAQNDVPNFFTMHVLFTESDGRTPISDDATLFVKQGREEWFQAPDQIEPGHWAVFVNRSSVTLEVRWNGMALKESGVPTNTFFKFETVLVEAYVYEYGGGIEDAEIYYTDGTGDKGRLFGLTNNGYAEREMLPVSLTLSTWYDEEVYRQYVDLAVCQYFEFECKNTFDILLRDENNFPVQGGKIYANNAKIGITDENGYLKYKDFGVDYLFRCTYNNESQEIQYDPSMNWIVWFYEENLKRSLIGDEEDGLILNILGQPIDKDRHSGLYIQNRKLQYK